MSYEIQYTDNFEREIKKLAKKHHSIKNDLIKLITKLEDNPNIGIPLGKNCFKIRMAISSKNEGKSGGARIITHVYVQNQIVYLLSIYDKSEQESITDKDILSILNQIKE